MNLTDFKFLLDLRKYFSLNLISLIGFVYFLVSLKYVHTVFPPYEDRGEGLVMSYEEGQYITVFFALAVMTFLLLCVFLLEIVLKALIFIIRKWRNKPVRIKKLPNNFWTILYSIAYLTGFLVYFYALFLS